MKRALILATAVLAAIAGLGPARALAAAEWHSQQPMQGSGSPLLGKVGDIEFEAPNRGMLITAGSGAVASGLFAYDGRGWYRYSTVCGGTEGRIAWAGPDEFWTISDKQVAEQQTETAQLSLCHFKDGQVVGSYAKPKGAADEYLRLDAAACNGPSDCWFAGQRMPVGSRNTGAFHLHWDGSSLTAIPSRTKAAELSDPGRAVTGLAFHQGSFYESVAVAAGDVPSSEEEAKEEAGLGPSLLHLIAPAAPTPFQPLFDAEAPAFEAGELEGFRLAGNEERLWAIAGDPGSSAAVTVLQLEGDHVIPVPLTDPGAVLGAEVSIGGAAAEPGAGGTWVALRPGSESSESIAFPARLALIGSDGSVGPEVTLPAAGEEVRGNQVGRKGGAGPIACAAAEQCWMATRAGWLFHLGADPPANEDPAMHVEIGSRPVDESVPVVPPLELPEDDSGEKQGSSGQVEVPSAFEPLPKRLPPLYSKVKQELIHGTVLELSFTLSARAHVQLVAQRKGRVVAKTRRYTLAKGRHTLRLPLDPKRWPTKLDLRIEKLTRKGSK